MSSSLSMWRPRAHGQLFSRARRADRGETIAPGGCNSPQCEARRNYIVYSERPRSILRREMAKDVSVAEERLAPPAEVHQPKHVRPNMNKIVSTLCTLSGSGWDNWKHNSSSKTSFRASLARILFTVASDETCEYKCFHNSSDFFITCDNAFNNQLA